MAILFDYKSKCSYSFDINNIVSKIYISSRNCHAFTRNVYSFKLFYSLEDA